MARDGGGPRSWDKGSDAAKAARMLGTSAQTVIAEEHPLEIEVSHYIRRMPFLWLAVDDEPGPDSVRGIVERNSIALLSNYKKAPLDRASGIWLGNYSDRERVKDAGLWNSNYVDESYDPSFLDILERQVERSALAERL